MIDVFLANECNATPAITTQGTNLGGQHISLLVPFLDSACLFFVWPFGFKAWVGPNNKSA